MTRWTAHNLPDLSGRIAVVTGGNSGIGRRTAEALAAHGARVVIACRDLSSAGRVRGVEVAALDLASLASVRAFASAWTGRLDLLVNNAGVMAPPRPVQTQDGFELQFGTNHLGHFALTGLLLPALLESEHGRVVTVASIAHHGGAADVLEGNVGTGYDPQRTYSNSKLANLLFARELQRQASERGLPLVSTAAHPGLSATGLASDREGMGARLHIRLLAPVALRVATQSAAAGARASLYAATSAAPGSYTGPRWLGETRGWIGPARLSEFALDESLGRRLWEFSSELTDVRYPWPA